MKKLMYIFILMLFVARLAAQQTYVIDSTCVDNIRTYTMIGELGSTYKWIVTNETYDTVYQSPGLPYQENISGVTEYGTQTDISWTVPGNYLITNIQTTEHDCDTIEAGYVRVFDPPFAFAGKDQQVCIADTISLYEAHAEYFSRVEWTTSGDGYFDDDSQLNPNYIPGYNDKQLTLVRLVITAYGLAHNGTCIPFRDTITIEFNDPEVTPFIHHLDCYNDFSGKIILFVSGNAPFDFEYSGPDGFKATHTNASSDTISGLAAGWYKWKVTDDMGCEAIDSVELTQPDELLADIINIQNVTCFGGDNGSAQVSVSGGTRSYFYLWDTDPVQMDPTAVNLMAGKYRITVNDAHKCVAKDSIIITEPEPLVLSADSVDAKCMGTIPGSVDLTVSGGTPYTINKPYRYSWSDETGFIASTEDIGDLPGDMLYTVFVTDSLGCMDTLSIYVNLEKTYEVSFNIDSILCYGGLGSIYLEVTPDATYSYIWSTGATTKNLVDVQAGNYNIIVSDPDGCEYDTTFTLNDPDELLAKIALSDTAVCEGNTIDLNGNPTGGTGKHTHSWTGSGASYLSATDIADPVFDGRVPGKFELIYTVTDENDCVISVRETLDIWPVTTETVSIDICPEDLPFTFIDSTYMTTGTYTYITTNRYGCDSIITLNLNVYDKIILATTPTNASSNIVANGSVTLQVNGGTFPYEYSWSNGVTTKDILHVLPGTYEVIVTDAHGCQARTTAVVLSETSTMRLICPPDITLTTCDEIESSRYYYYKQFVAAGGGATSICGIDTATFEQIGPDEYFDGDFCFNIHRRYVVLDSCGNPAYCEQDIFVDDQIRPEITCPPEIIVVGISVPAPYRNYDAFEAAGGFADDNCAIDESTFRRTGNDVSDGKTDPETLTRTYQITDICGNTNVCQQLIYVYSNTSFSISAPPDSSIQCPGDLPLPFATYDEYINAGGSIESTNGVIDENSFTYLGNDIVEGDPCFQTVTRTYSISDMSGNTTSWAHTITIHDTEKPTLAISSKTFQCLDKVPPAISTEEEFKADPKNIASDNCELDWSTLRLSRPPSIDGTCPRTIIRYYLIDDMCGNVSNEAREIITINDTQKPDTIRSPKSLYADCEIPEPYASVADFNTNSGSLVIDNCGIAYVKIRVLKQDTLEYDCPVRLIRWYRFTDLCDNFRDVPQIIIVNDTDAPVITCPPPLTFDASVNELEALTGLAFSETAQTIDLSITATLGISTFENCELVEITYEDTAVGGCPAIVTRTFTAYDHCGNVGTCTQEITLSRGILISETHIDLGPSVLAIGSIDITVSGGDGPYTFAWSNGETTEDITDLYAGDYTVTVTDINGCESSITVTITKEDIVTTIDCPPMIEVECHADVNANPPYTYYNEFIYAGGKAESNCGIDTTTFGLVSQDTIDGIFCLTIERTYTISDFCGNDITCTHLIIVNDTEPPAITCPPDVNMECLSGIDANIETIEEFIAAGGFIYDNCGIDSSSFTVNKVVTRIPGFSEISITYSISDLCGNTASCTQTLISTDTEPPVANCTDITVYLDEIGQYLLTGADSGRIIAGSSDNCTNPEDLIINIDITEFDCEDIAEDGVLVHILITDEAGNETECIATITVLDTIPPDVVCKDITVYLDENGTAGITTADIDDGSIDNCGLDSIYLSKYIFDCNDVGENPVTLAITDNYGLNETCTSTVTVIDSIPPVVNCVPPYVIQLDENAQYALTVDEIHVSSFDECGIDTLYLDIYDLNCDHIGQTPVTLTAVDVNGNSSSCITELTVYGNIAPVVQPDSAITAMNIPVEIDVAANDYDTKTRINLSTLAVQLKPLHGIVEENKVNGILTYYPKLNYVGNDTLTYQICDDAIPCEKMCGEAFVYIIVLDENNPPEALDDNYEVYCSPLTGDLLDNDSDPDGNNIQINIKPVKLPIHGTVFIEDDGSFTYIPDEGFNGLDSFRYEICDNGLPSMCDTASVYIEKFPDYDCDGISDADDIDDDDDGILDVVEGNRTIDSDGDGIWDSLDIDSDNDGIVDNIEGQGEGPGEYIFPSGVDANGNGWDDAYDPEMGGYKFDPEDTDNDGMPDYVDIDSENDHVFDFIEGHDINADGIPDVTRVFVDSDHDGLDDIFDTVNGWSGSMDTRNALGSNAPLQDFDGDGIRDWRDTNDENDEFMTVNEDTNNDGDYSNDDLDLDGFPEYLDRSLDCELFIPEGFSPNDDGVHDFFQILCIQKYPNAHLMIFNRNGDKLYDKEHYGNLDVWGTNENAWWWGISENKLTIGREAGLPQGNYVYVLELGNGEVKNGTVMIAY